jgi:COMPASS component SWD2
MDLDLTDVSSPANGTPSTSLNITRTLGGSLPSTSAITDVMSMFRPTKVEEPRPHVDVKAARLSS